jgi:hypothetical protein
VCCCGAILQSMMNNDELIAFYNLSLSEDRQNYELVLAYPEMYRRQLFDYIISNLNSSKFEIKEITYLSGIKPGYYIQTFIVFDLKLATIVDYTRRKLSETVLLSNDLLARIKYEQGDTDSVSDFDNDSLFLKIRQCTANKLQIKI